MGFSRQEYWSGLSFPSPGDPPDPETELESPTLQAGRSPSEPPGTTVRMHLASKNADGGLWILRTGRDLGNHWVQNWPLCKQMNKILQEVCLAQCHRSSLTTTYRAFGKWQKRQTNLWGPVPPSTTHGPTPSHWRTWSVTDTGSWCDLILPNHSQGSTTLPRKEIGHAPPSLSCMCPPAPSGWLTQGGRLPEARKLLGGRRQSSRHFWALP